MPLTEVVTDTHRFTVLALQYPKGPEDFLEDWEIDSRIAIARNRVIDAIRNDGNPLRGHGLNCEVYGLDGSSESLAAYVDRIDDRRADRVRKHRDAQPEEAIWAPYGPRSPQNVARRRSAIFGGSDLPPNYCIHPKPEMYLRDDLVNLQRWRLTVMAINLMVLQNEIEYVGGVWGLKIATLDERRRLGRRKNRVKDDDRTYHGLDQGSRKEHKRLPS